MANSGELTVLQINDTHAYLNPHPEVFWGPAGPEYRTAGGYARLATLVREARRTNPGGVLLLDNGDTLHGTYPAVQTRGQALVPLLNYLGPQAMTAHWEFAYGPETFKQRAAELEYPVLALNVHHKESGELFFEPYTVLEMAGLRVGVAGLASNIVDKTMPAEFSRGLSFGSGREALPGVVESLRQKEKVDLVLLLSHLGFPQDLQLVSDVPGIDLCLSGHTHNRVYQPVRQGDTLVIQSGSHGSFLGWMDLEVTAGKVTGFRHRLVEVTPDIRPDPEMEALVQGALVPFERELSQTAGETAAPLDRGLNLETTMDNFLLHSIRASTGAQLAFSNGWRYGAPVLAGEITLNDLYNITPMNPPVSTVELTGDELVEMLEENLEHTYSADPYRQMGGYLKRALGLKVYFKVENPRGRRIQKLYVGDREVQPGQTYTAAFVTEQGVPAKYGNNRQKGSENAVEAMRKYLASHSPVRIELQGTFVLV